MPIDTQIILLLVLLWGVVVAIVRRLGSSGSSDWAEDLALGFIILGVLGVVLSAPTRGAIVVAGVIVIHGLAVGALGLQLVAYQRRRRGTRQ